MPNYKITIEYDGTHFFGWQLQKDKRTVQGELEGVIQKLSGGRIVRVHGAGRTDTGVHAIGQCANFKIEKRWNCERLKKAINGNLRDDLFVHQCEIVPDEFHARFSAKKRRYMYRCRLDESVIDRHYLWRLVSRISVYRLRICANILLGEHDVTSFCKFSDSYQHPKCSIYQSSWTKRGVFVTYVIEANRFFQHMIRYLVGTMIEVGKGKLTVDNFKHILMSKNPEAKVYKAPPHGLYLEKVYY